MNVFHTADAMRAWSEAQRAAGKTIGFTPTMGALHPGHESLMRAAAAQNDVSVLSIYVNPTQFAPHEDFNQYPRTLEADSALAARVGVNAIYAPADRAMYPEGYATYVDIERITQRLCGGSRPHFFRGVATVVTKLFNAVRPHRAYFGQKDAQQAAVIRRMTRDLDMGIEIVEMPIVREPDGLAMSSRNKYLSPGERQRALCLSRGLSRARDLLNAGERDPHTIIDTVQNAMSAVDIDYIELVDAEDIIPLDRVRGTVLLAVAARVGETRLIDNIKFTVPDDEE
ncbi:MAG TPA: pantoate--beta-alanine ligase [Candidatus Hydrogenedentes bacterium]|jgi:pantoate--beta-alanine ligase|nr:pantoate--beta-alanine ligase [Candidatus Hydrogenedentota bacterium]MDY0032633.1 pantoate--beta-alanine ligase [FCB group bacterium]NLT62780.1 pantoate--beta-alanine ligase [Candidatus Hydrogenedentota bacterium]HNZ20294.1 pantoate--beta-alanine ligase [Candidatus Hydrogenedentota bacterium]HOH35886.1 pantoate--beta-alanine ligase [Candidatus Hydrogenedentota bacterium]